MARIVSNSVVTTNRQDLDLPTTSWLRQVRLGCGLTLWFLLLPLLLTNVAAFMLPLVGGNTAHLKFVGLIYMFGGIPLLVGIVKLTVAPNPDSPEKKFDYSRRAFRVFAALDMITRVVNSVLRLTTGGSESTYLDVLMTLTDVGWVVSAAVYLTCACRLIGARQPASQIPAAASIYIVLIALISYLDPTGQTAGATVFAQLSVVLVATAIGGWGLWILWRFRGIVIRMCEGRCVDCGYLLKGLPENRCPECGTPFMPLPDGGPGHLEQEAGASSRSNKGGKENKG